MNDFTEEELRDYLDDLHLRSIQEEKEHTVNTLILYIYDSLFKAIEHGDPEHRAWLKDKMNEHRNVILDALMINHE